MLNKHHFWGNFPVSLGLFEPLGPCNFLMKLHRLIHSVWVFSRKASSSPSVDHIKIFVKLWSSFFNFLNFPQKRDVKLHLPFIWSKSRNLFWIHPPHHSVNNFLGSLEGGLSFRLRNLTDWVRKVETYKLTLFISITKNKVLYL